MDTTQIVTSLLSTLIGPAVLLWMGKRLDRRINAVGTATHEVREQVKNSHSTNLRDDLDTIHSEIRGVRADVGDVRGDLALVHREVGDVRAEQRHQDQRLRALETGPQPHVRALP